MLTPFIRALIRIAKLQGRSVLESVITGQFETVSQDGGRVLSGTSYEGKSFSFQVPADLSTKEIMGSAEVALGHFDSSTEEEIEAVLKIGARNKAVIRFC